jgi:hypothetical protein
MNLLYKFKNIKTIKIKNICITLIIALGLVGLGFYTINLNCKYDYEINNWKVNITRYHSNETYVKIPNHIWFMPVVAIDDYAFEGLMKLRKVQIPHNVTSIGIGAFSYCMNMEEIELPIGIKEIKDNTFYFCEELKKIDIPEGVTKIGNSSFSICDFLRIVNLPNSLESIGEYAFSECSSLTSIKLPTGLITIDNFAFVYNEDLEEVFIPQGVKTIGKGNFYDCDKLTLIISEGSVAEQYAVDNGIEYEIDIE